MNRTTMSSAVWQITRASLALGALGPAQAEGAGRLKGLKISVTAAVPGIDVANVAVTVNTVPVTYAGTGFSSGPWVTVFWGHTYEPGHDNATNAQLALSSPGSWRGSFSHVFPDSGSYTVSARSCCAASTVTTGNQVNSSITAATTVVFPGPHVEICGELDPVPPFSSCPFAEAIVNDPKNPPIRVGLPGPTTVEYVAEYLVNYGPTFVEEVADYFVNYGPTFVERVVEYYVP